MGMGTEASHSRQRLGRQAVFYAVGIRWSSRPLIVMLSSGLLQLKAGG